MCIERLSQIPLLSITTNRKVKVNRYSFDKQKCKLVNFTIPQQKIGTYYGIIEEQFQPNH